MAAIDSTRSVSSIMQDINLGPGGGIQLMFAKLQLAQAALCKDQANDYMQQVQAIQDEQLAVSKMVDKARELKTKAEGGFSNMPQDMVDFFNKRGLSIEGKGNDTKHNPTEWDYNLKSLTNYQENVGAKTQTLMVYLQDFIGQYNSFLQGANSAINESNQTLTNILRK